MSEVNSSHVLALALQLVEVRLEEAIAKIGQGIKSDDALSEMIERIVDKKLAQQPLVENVVEPLVVELRNDIKYNRIKSDQYTDDSTIQVAKYAAGIKTALDTHHHNDKYSDIAHNHNDQYSAIDHSHDSRYVTKDTFIGGVAHIADDLDNLAKTTSDAHESIRGDMGAAHDEIRSKIDSVDSKRELDKKVAEESLVNFVNDVATKHNAIHECIGMVGDAHDQLRSTVDTHKSATEKSIAELLKSLSGKSDADHEHDYAKQDHSHDYAESIHEHPEYLTNDHMVALNSNLSAIDQAHTQRYDSIVKSLENKVDSGVAITKDDLENLKGELKLSIQESIQVPKDAHEWEFKQHATRTGTILYRRSDWKNWKQFVLFNQNLLNEINGALARAYNPVPSMTGIMGGASYQDPKELVGYTRLDDHKDVDTTTIPPMANDLLVWNAMTQQWVPKTIQELASLLTPILEADLNRQYTKLIDVIDADTTIIGESLPGTATSVAGWRIKKIVESVDGDVTITWANASADFVEIWDNRLSLTYSI